MAKSKFIQPSVAAPAPGSAPESPAVAPAADPDMAMDHPVVHRPHSANAPYAP